MKILFLLKPMNKCLVTSSILHHIKAMLDRSLFESDVRLTFAFVDYEEKIKEEEKEREGGGGILLRKWISIIFYGKCKRIAYHDSRATLLHANGFFPWDEHGDIGNYFVIIVGREIAVHCMNAHIRCIHNSKVCGNKESQRENTRPPVHLSSTLSLQ